MLTVWHRPKTQHIFHLKESGVTMLITCQADREHAQAVGKECKRLGLKWVHVPLGGANLNRLKNREDMAKVITGLDQAYHLLKDGKEKALLHCAAGIHRTGICTYTLLRCSGEAKTRGEAMECIKAIRLHTHDGVRDWRINLAEEILIPLLSEKLSIDAPKQELVEIKDRKILAKLKSLERRGRAMPPSRK
uniref:Tyrosine specific protein phosphatases domain-containing protein n=2 Tax=Lotharella globosa TaxID=91324 RepID=A0A7S3Z034_9EUKA